MAAHALIALFRGDDDHLAIQGALLLADGLQCLRFMRAAWTSKKR